MEDDQEYDDQNRSDNVKESAGNKSTMDEFNFMLDEDEEEMIYEEVVTSQAGQVCIINNFSCESQIILLYDGTRWCL